MPNFFLVKRKAFREKRRQHYNEFQTALMAKQLMEEDDDDSDDVDRNVFPESQKKPTPGCTDSC